MNKPLTMTLTPDLLPTPSVHKAQIANRFSRAAGSYDSAAALQREVGHELMQMASLPVLTKLNEPILLDIGSGTGYFCQLWRERGLHVIALDLAEGMLDFARSEGRASSYICADMEALPLADASVDYCFSSLAMQWSDDLATVLRECRRVTKPGGLILFSTLLQGTLHELQAAWKGLDQQKHINHFLCKNEVNIALAQAGIRHYHLNFSHKKVMYPSVVALMRDLKAIGANHRHGERNPGLGGKQQLAELEQRYRDRFEHQTMLPASYEVCCGVIVNE